MKSKKGTVWILLGLLLLAAALLLTGYNVWDSFRAEKASREVVEDLEKVIRKAPVSEDSLTAAAEGETEEEWPEFFDFPEREMPTVERNGYRYIGILDVPSLNLSLPVMEEWDYTRLQIAPCRYTGSVFTDDLVIAAHNYATHFSPLKWVPVDTEIIFTDAEGEEYHYAVSAVEIVKPTDIEGMITGDWDLTLFTCTTGGQTRCAVRCDRIDE